MIVYTFTRLDAILCILHKTTTSLFYPVLSTAGFHRTKDIFTSNVNIPEGRPLSDPEYRVLADPIIIVLFVSLFFCVCGGGNVFLYFSDMWTSGD